MTDNTRPATPGALQTTPDNSDENDYFLPQQMPSTIALGLTSFLIGCTFAAVLVIIFVPFPESIKSTFILVPPQGMEPIKMPREGIVERVAVADGDQVNAGDLLFVISSDSLRTLALEKIELQQKLASSETRLLQLQAEATARRLVDTKAIAELRALHMSTQTSQAPYTERAATIQQLPASINELLEQEYQLKLQTAQSQVDSLRAQIPLAQQQLDTAKTLLQRLENARLNQGATSQLDVDRQRFAYQEARLRLEQIPFQLQQAEAALQSLITARQTAVKHEILAAIERQAELQQLEIVIASDRKRLSALEQELEGVEGEHLHIHAPQSGTIVTLAIRQAGAVVARGDVLCQLAPSDAVLKAELDVPEKSVGQLAPGQKVRLLFDAYPYTRFGVQSGTLDWVSPVGADTRFRALTTLQDLTITVKGETQQLRVGMGGEARITVGRRTLLDYVLEPLRQLRENLGT